MLSSRVLFGLVTAMALFVLGSGSIAAGADNSQQLKNYQAQIARLNEEEKVLQEEQQFVETRITDVKSGKGVLFGFEIAGPLEIGPLEFDRQRLVDEIAMMVFTGQITSKQAAQAGAHIVATQKLFLKALQDQSREITVKLSNIEDSRGMLARAVDRLESTTASSGSYPNLIGTWQLTSDDGVFQEQIRITSESDKGEFSGTLAVFNKDGVVTGTSPFTGGFTQGGVKYFEFQVGSYESGHYYCGLHGSGGNITMTGQWGSPYPEKFTAHELAQ